MKTFSHTIEKLYFFSGKESANRYNRTFVAKSLVHAEEIVKGLYFPSVKIEELRHTGLRSRVCLVDDISHKENEISVVDYLFE